MDEMLKGMYNAELKETCMFFMPKEPKQKSEIKACSKFRSSI